MPCIQQLQKYLQVAHSQHSDFDFEWAKDQVVKNKVIVDPCLTQKRGAPGSPMWCLCEDGQKVKWDRGDSSQFDQKTIDDLRKELKNKQPYDKERANELLLSYCTHAHEEKTSPRFEHCRWEGEGDGMCCSKKKGCLKIPTLDSNRE